MNDELLNHSYYTGIIKNILKASFVGWIEEKDKKSLRIVINKKEFLLPLEGGTEITHETYNQLVKGLITQENGELQESI
jgi:hypothetical protein